MVLRRNKEYVILGLLRNEDDFILVVYADKMGLGILEYARGQRLGICYQRFRLH
jgi:hypothetical protein